LSGPPDFPHSIRYSSGLRRAEALAIAQCGKIESRGGVAVNHSSRFDISIR
jgi:hypothetical protein